MADNTLSALRGEALAHIGAIGAVLAAALFTNLTPAQSLTALAVYEIGRAHV